MAVVASSGDCSITAASKRVQVRVSPPTCRKSAGAFRQASATSAMARTRCPPQGVRSRAARPAKITGRLAWQAAMWAKRRSPRLWRSKAPKRIRGRGSAMLIGFAGRGPIGGLASVPGKCLPGSEGIVGVDAVGWPVVGHRLELAEPGVQVGLVLGYGRWHRLGLVDEAVDAGPVDEAQAAQHLVCRQEGLEGLRYLEYRFDVPSGVFVHRFEGGHDQPPPVVTGDQGLIDDPHRRSNRKSRENLGCVLRVEMDAAMAGAHADPPGPVGAMDVDARKAGAHGQHAHRVVRPGRKGLRYCLAFVAEMLGLDALGHEPARILVLANDAGLTQRRRPAFAGNADGIGDDLARLSLRRCGEVIQPALGDVDYNSPPGWAGQNELGGDHHPGA